jgi:hypothetical protein
MIPAIIIMSTVLYIFPASYSGKQQFFILYLPSSRTLNFSDPGPYHPPTRPTLTNQPKKQQTFVSKSTIMRHYQLLCCLPSPLPFQLSLAFLRKNQKYGGLYRGQCSPWLGHGQRVFSSRCCTPIGHDQILTSFQRL